MSSSLRCYSRMPSLPCLIPLILCKNLARDPWSSPPTAAEMASIDLVYVNDRLIAMKLPVDKRSPELASAASGSGTGKGGRTKERGTGGLIRPQDGNDIDVVAALLRSRHAGHYMVWNVSEESYDYSMFEDQVSRRGGMLYFSPFYTAFCV